MMMFKMFRTVSQASLMLLRLLVSVHFWATSVWSRPQISSPNVATIFTPSEVLTTGIVTRRIRRHVTDIPINISRSEAEDQRINTDFNQNENPPALLFCSLIRSNCVFNASSDNASFVQETADDDTLCHRELRRLPRRGVKNNAAHDIKGQRISNNLTMLFFESCPSGYEDTAITRQCEMSANDETNLELVHIVPVVSYFENVMFMFKNVFCAFCQNFTSNSDLSLTLSCPDGIELGTDKQGLPLHRLIRQCTTSVAVSTALERLVFPFSISPGRVSLTDTNSPKPCESQARSCIDSSVCECLQINNCTQKVTGNVGTQKKSNEKAQKDSGSTKNMDTGIETHLTKASKTNTNADENANNQVKAVSSGDTNPNNQTEDMSSGKENTKDQEKHREMEIINDQMENLKSLGNAMESSTEVDNHQQLMGNLSGDMQKSKNDMVSMNHSINAESDMVTQSPKKNSFDSESRLSDIHTELTVTMVDYGEDVSHSPDEVTCTGNESRIPTVCFKTDWRFYGLRQLWTLTCFSSDLYAYHKVILLIKSHLYTFRPKPATVWRLESNERTITSQILMVYASLVSPRDLLDTLLEMNMNSFPNCSINSLSKLSTCIEENQVIEDKIFNTLNMSHLSFNTIAYDKSPCQSVSRVDSDGLLDLSHLNCTTKVQVTKEEFEKLKNSQKCQGDTHEHTADDQNVWICTDLLRDKKEESSDCVAARENEKRVDWGETFATVVCTSISLAALAMTLIFKFASHNIYSLPVKLMMNLMASLFISQALLLLMAIDNQAWCTSVAIMSHYFWLSTFCWMFISAIHMYKTFSCSVFAARGSLDSKHCLMVYSIAGYGSPLLIVIPSVVVDFCACLGEDISIGYGREVCFISEPIANIATFAAPTALIIFMNLILFTRTFYQIKKTSNAVESVQAVHINSYKIFLKISSLFGFTWIFGYIAMLTSNKVIWYIFTIVNSLQGLHIFIAFGIRDGKDVLRRMVSIIPFVRRESTRNTMSDSCPAHIPQGCSVQTLSASIDDISTKL